MKLYLLGGVVLDVPPAIRTSSGDCASLLGERLHFGLQGGHRRSEIVKPRIRPESAVLFMSSRRFIHYPLLLLLLLIIISTINCYVYNNNNDYYYLLLLVVSLP